MKQRAEIFSLNKGQGSFGLKVKEKPLMVDIAGHWDTIYSNSEEEKLGWFETDFSPAEKLIKLAAVNQKARILIAGAGNSRLVDRLLRQGYSSITATDISSKSLSQLKERVGAQVSYVVDDLTDSCKLPNIKPIDLWIDRAVLHFFVNEKERNNYLSLLNHLVKSGGYVLLAEFAEDGAEKCSGLPLLRYSVEMMQDFLTNEYTMVEHFRYIYTMPSGDLRPYNYALFRRN